MKKNVHYEYEIVGGLDQSVVLKTAGTREEARQQKRRLDRKQPNETHRIIQYRHTVAVQQVR